MTTPDVNGKLDTVRKLLAKAEAEGTTTHEAEALTAKAAELMAKYGIDRALLAAAKPETDKPGNRIFTVDTPWATTKALLLGSLARALRCEAIQLNGRAEGSVRVHVFGYSSDLERLDVLYTSLLLQMTSGLRRAEVPRWDSPRAYRRSWMLGFTGRVVQRVKAAEAAAVQESADQRPAGMPGAGPGTDVVLADRALVVNAQVKAEYPRLRSARTTYSSGSGFGAGSAAGARASLGGTSVGAGAGRALGR